MVGVRAAALAVALVVAAVVNVFFAPQIYSPRAPVFSGVDLAENETWRGHGFGLHPTWLATMLPNSTFENVRIGQPEWADQKTGNIGIFWDQRGVAIEQLRTDAEEFPLDISAYDLSGTIKEYHQISALIRCHSDPLTSGRALCDYFVAWDDSVDPSEPLTFVAVFTTIASGGDEVGFIEQSLLERLVGSNLDELPTIGERPL
jgi:hypothetical protein